MATLFGIAFLIGGFIGGFVSVVFAIEKTRNWIIKQLEG